MIDIIAFWNNCLENDDESKSTLTPSLLGELTEQTIQFIGQQVLLNNEITTLEWGHLEAFVLSKIELSDPLNDYCHPQFFLAILQHAVDEKKENYHVQITYDSVQSAVAFQKLLYHVLPFTTAEFPLLDDKSVFLNFDQHFFLIRNLSLGMNGLTSNFTKNFYLKTLRADEFDFTSSFLITLFNTGSESRAFQNLRPKNRGTYIIDSDGKILTRHEKTPDTSKPKIGYTQIQSVTLIDDFLITAPFGFNRRDKLYGIMTHQDDLIIKRLLKHDFGTIDRPFEIDSIASAHREAKFFNTLKKLNNRTQYSEKQLDEFKKANLATQLSSMKTNEVLARIRFNPHKSFISICSNSLKSRLLALDFSEEIMENYVEKSKDNGMMINFNFKLTIIIYQKNDPRIKIPTIIYGHDISLYTSQMRQQDTEECHRIYKDKTTRLQYYVNHDFEFLLGLFELTEQIFFQDVKGLPLALHMIKHGYARMLMRLVRPARLKKMPETNPKLIYNIFNKLQKEGYIEKNDPIISEFIMIESYDLATHLITLTNSITSLLTYRGIALKDHLVEKGNPRQISYVGLNELLLYAANKNHWTTIRLCLKEIKNIEQKLLTKLLEMAYKANQYSEMILLLQLKAGDPKTINTLIYDVNKQSSIEWLIIELIIRHYDNCKNCPEFCRSLILALRNKKFKLAREIAKIAVSQEWRTQDTEKYQFQSALFYAIKFNLIDLFEFSIQQELIREDDNSNVRLQLCLDLARYQKNSTAIELLDSKTDQPTQINSDDSLMMVCKLVFEAYYLGENALAEWRLFHYGRRLNVLPTGCDNIIDGLKVLLPGYSKTLLRAYKKSSIEPYLYIANVFLCHYNIELYQNLFSLTNDIIQVPLKQSESTIAKKILEIFSLEKIEQVKDVICISKNAAIWLWLLSSLLNELYLVEANTLRTEFDTRNSRGKAYIELIIHTLTLMNKSSVCVTDSADYSLTLNAIKSIFKMSYILKNEKALEFILSHTDFTNHIQEDLLSDIIEENKLGWQIYHDKSDTEFLFQLLNKYAFTVRKKHLFNIVKSNQFSKLGPILEVMKDEEYQNPNFFWDYFKLWIKLKYGNHRTIPIENGYSSILEIRLGSIRCLHYTLLFLLLVLYHTFNMRQMNHKFLHIRDLFDSEPMRTIEKEYQGVLKSESDCTKKFNPTLKILNNYLSQTIAKFDAPPNTNILLNTYSKLNATLRQALPAFPAIFFRSNPNAVIAGKLFNLLHTADPMLEQIKNDAVFKTTPQPSSPSIVK